MDVSGNAESASEFPPSRPFAARLSDAIRRRAKSAWRRWSWGDPPPAVEAVFDWLAGHADGLAAHPGESLCPAVTGAAIEAAAAYGADDLVARWRETLLAAQQPDGSFRRAGRRETSCRQTGFVLRGLLAAEEMLPTADSRHAVLRAAEALADRLAAINVPPVGALTCLPPLRAASRLCGIPRGERLAADVLRRLRRTVDLARWDGSLEEHAARLDALWELRDLTDGGSLEFLLDDALALPAAWQRRDGGVPDRPGGANVSHAGVARLALLWLRVPRLCSARGGCPMEAQSRTADTAVAPNLDRAGRALDYLAVRVLRLCSARGGCSREACWTAIWFLRAMRLRVAAAFDGEASSPGAIHPADGRWVAVADVLCGLPPAARVLDAGCGDGRYLRRIAMRFPRLRLVGIDPAPAALAKVPEGIENRRGELLRLPAEDGEFDAAICIEALEHSLLPRRAVAELCRVVRPGGRLLIVDKDAARQRLSRHEPWERWFASEELRGWLAEHCDRAAARHIPHGVPPRDPRLFLAWTGVRAATCPHRVPTAA